MLENRSVDHYLGWYAAENDGFDARQHASFPDRRSGAPTGSLVATEAWGAPVVTITPDGFRGSGPLVDLGPGPAQRMDGGLPQQEGASPDPRRPHRLRPRVGPAVHLRQLGPAVPEPPTRRRHQPGVGVPRVPECELRAFVRPLRASGGSRARAHPRALHRPERTSMRWPRRGGSTARRSAPTGASRMPTSGAGPGSRPPPPADGRRTGKRAPTMLRISVPSPIPEKGGGPNFRQTFRDSGGGWPLVG